MRRELGDWLRRRLKKGVGEQGSAAREVLSHCSATITELQEQWTNQRETQLSIRARPYTSLHRSYITDMTRCTCQIEERT